MQGVQGSVVGGSGDEYDDVPAEGADNGWFNGLLGWSSWVEDEFPGLAGSVGRKSLGSGRGEATLVKVTQGHAGGAAGGSTRLEEFSTFTTGGSSTQRTTLQWRYDGQADAAEADADAGGNVDGDAKGRR